MSRNLTPDQEFNLCVQFLVGNQSTNQGINADSIRYAFFLHGIRDAIYKQAPAPKTKSKAAIQEISMRSAIINNTRARGLLSSFVAYINSANGQGNLAGNNGLASRVRAREEVCTTLLAITDLVCTQNIVDNIRRTRMGHLIGVTRDNNHVINRITQGGIDYGAVN